MGDVAMTVPVLDSFARAYPQHHITMMSDPRFEPFFCGMPANFTFLGADVHKTYHGTAGLRVLIKELTAQHFDLVLDLHGVLRTEFISTGLLLRGIPVHKIHKGRLGRKALTRQHFKRVKPLPASFERYQTVFSKAGFKFPVDFKSVFSEAPQGILSRLGSKTGKWIGVAPFAAHQGKIYPIDQMEQVIAGLQAEQSVERIYVFAYGKEKLSVTDWESKYNKVSLTGGKYTLSEEMELTCHLDVMLSMDSSNMHLASLVGTRVVSVWGATHPSAGFLGYGQSLSDCVQISLPCRPCSIFGKKPCRYADCRCLTSIPARQILQKLLQ